MSRSDWPNRSESLPPATVIVPVKGYDEGLRENLAALAALDYPDYEFIITAHSAADIPFGVLPARVRVVLAHGKDTGSVGEDSEPDGSRARGAQTHPGPGLRRFRRPRDGRLAARAGGSARRTRRRRVHRLSLVPARSARFLVAAARCVGRGGGWGCSAPATIVSCGAAPWRSAKSSSSRRAFRSSGRARSPTTSRSAQAVHAAGLTIAYAPGALTPCVEHIGSAASSAGSAGRWRSCGCTPRGSGGRP